jgi:putative ABC transport system permease protein
MVAPAPSRRGGVARASDSGRKLKDEDAAAIAAATSATAVSEAVGATGQVVHGNRNWNTLVSGTLNSQFGIREWPLERGRFFSESEEHDAGKVGVIGATTASKLFGDEDPIGQTVRIANVPIRIVGLLANKGALGSGTDQDDVVFVPLQTARMRLLGAASDLDRRTVAFILAKARSSDQVGFLVEQIKAVLRQRHLIQAGQDDDFMVADPVAAIRAQRSSTQTVSDLLNVIACVSLLVGGVSVMNVMLAAVTERTREIGLRIAVGARRSDIRDQFLAEALALCSIGGCLGIALGVAAARIVQGMAGWPVQIEPTAIVVPVFFSGAIGLIFGYYPARRAARLDPVAALRSE